MKAWVCREFRDPFVLNIEDVDEPEPGPGEVKIKVAAAGLSFGEILILKGTYQKTPPLPYIPVSEMSGIVQSCGEGVTRCKIGDRITAVSFKLGGGGLAEMVVLPETSVFPVPSDMGLIEAAAFPANYWTAYNALGSRGQLQSGEFVLIHGATGGVGVAAIEVAKMFGATVIATGHNAERLQKVLRLGADHVIDLGREDLREQVRKITGGRGADVILDTVGGKVFDDSLRCIAPGGRILVVGFTSGEWASVRTNILLVKMISVIGIEGRLAIETTDGKGFKEFNRMLSLFADGKLQAHVGNTYQFEDALKGCQDIVDRKHFGKSVLIVSRALCEQDQLSN